MTRLAVLWHHHQPDYRDPTTGRPLMPWTRLHALRGYRDLAVALLESGCPMTINLVPSLLEQLVDCARGADDPHAELTRRPAAELDPMERAELLRTFVAGHPAMWEAHAPAQALRGRWAAGRLSGVQDLRDLQVWSTLVWAGFSARRDEPALAALIAKGQGFTEDDKAVLIEACDRLVAEVVPLHRRLVAEGRAELSASAATHPILPLLIDTHHARRCMPALRDVEIPDFRWPEDALLQLQRGRARVAALTGAEVRGLWPSEGSVSPELLPLAAEAGFTWLVSDLGNLERSARHPATRAQGPWDLGHGLKGFFRDTQLSDRIGFSYARRDPEEAVEELLGAARARGPLCVIALDGENPWESYPDAGEGFLRALTRRLMKGGAVQPVRFADAGEPVGRVHALHTGSWIGSDFAIWIGDDEDRAAWQALAEVRAAVRAAGDPPEAMEHVLAAEGSDWFWWYGKEFSTPFALEFDRLFRSHVAAAWRALGQAPPASLQLPIKRVSAGSASCVRQPDGPLAPALDARPEDLPGWLGAGEVDCAMPGGAMARGVTHLRRILWGRSGARLVLRLLHQPEVRLPEGAEWLAVVTVDGEGPRALRWPVGGAPEGGAASAEVTDLGVPVPEGVAARFHLALVSQGAEVARYPRDGVVDLVGEGPWWV